MIEIFIRHMVEIKVRELISNNEKQKIQYSGLRNSGLQG